MTNWRDIFAKENIVFLQKTLQTAGESLKDSIYSELDDIKRKRINGMFKEAVNNSSSRGVIDFTGSAKFLYSTTPQVGPFIEITEFSDCSGLERILKQNRELLKGEELNLAEYGCGNGLKTAYVTWLLHELFPTEERREVHLIDFNDVVLQIGTTVMETIATGCNFEIIPEDPLDLEYHAVPRKRGDRSRLHTYLGQTLGNSKDSTAVAISLNRSMKKGEYLVVEWFKRRAEEYERGNLAVRTFNVLTNYFSKMGIPSEYLTQDEEGHFMMEEKDEKGGVWNVGYLVIKDRFKHPSGIVLEKGTKILGFRSKQFQEGEVIKLFEKVGLEGVVQQELVTFRDSRAGDTPWKDREVQKIKWLSDGYKRYALFKKVRAHDPKNVFKMSMLGLAAACGLAFGGYFFSNDGYIHCTDTMVHNREISCISGEQKLSFPIGELNDLQVDGCMGEACLVKVDSTTKNLVIPGFADKKLVVTAKYKEAKYIFESADRDSQIRLYLNILPSLFLRYSLQESHPEKCIPTEICPVEEESCSGRVTLYVFDCTESINTAEIVNSIGARYSSPPQIATQKRILEKIIQSAFNTRNGDEVYRIAHIFNDLNIVLALKKVEEATALRKKIILPVQEPWYKEKVDATGILKLSPSELAVDFLYAVALMGNEVTKQKSVGLVTYFGSMPETLDESKYLVLPALVEASHYFGSENLFGNFITFSTNTLHFKDGAVLSIVLTEVARKIAQEGGSEYSRIPFLKKNEGRLFRDVVENVNNIASLFDDPSKKAFVLNVMPPIIGSALEYNADSDLHWISFLYLYTGAYQHSCIQERILELCSKDKKLREKCLDYHQQLMDTLVRVSNASTIKDQNFPYDTKLCQQQH